MKKLLVLFLMFALIVPAFAGNQWREGTGQDTILGSISPSDIDKDSFENGFDPIGRLNSNYREGVGISYASASTLTVSSGELMLSNAAGSIPLMQSNTSAITVDWSMIDAGAEESSKTYYLYGYQATATDTDFDISISLSSTTPTGITYYKRIGSFYNDASGNITYDGISNDNDYYGLKLGAWESKSANVSYLAATDGVATAYNATGFTTHCYTDASNPPATIRIKVGDASAPDGCTIPVKRGDYWKIVTNGGAPVAYWIPNE